MAERIRKVVRERGEERKKKGREKRKADKEGKLRIIRGVTERQTRNQLPGHFDHLR